MSGVREERCLMFEEIKEQFEKVVSFSQDIDMDILNVDQLFDEWLEAKRDIIEAFDGKLIYEVEKPIQFHLDPQDRQKRFDDFVYRIYSIYDNKELADFLTNNCDGFYENTVCVPYEKDDIKIPKGMKLVKAFKFFEKEKSLLEQFQIQASQVIQEDKIEGKLCFSVHPLDFLSVSVNNYNWRSCHALDGEYCAGNLSYMRDKSTIICYLKGSEEDTNLPMFPLDVPWNSKKWRVLLYLSDKWDMIMAGRQYPFASENGLDIALTFLLDALKMNAAMGDFTSWRCDYVSGYTTKSGKERELSALYIPIRGRLYDFANIVEDLPNSLQFNDLLHSSTYHEPYYSIKHDYGWMFSEPSIPKISVGGEVQCLCCNHRRIQDHDMMVCRTCADHYDLYNNGENHPTCDCCGSRIYDDDWYDVEGETLCRNCYERECFVCASCECDCFNDDKHYDRANDEYICTRCMEERLEE